MYVVMFNIVTFFELAEIIDDEDYEDFKNVLSPTEK